MFYHIINIKVCQIVQQPRHVNRYKLYHCDVANEYNDNYRVDGNDFLMS